MKNVKILLMFLIFCFSLFVSGCTEIDNGDINRLLGNIDFSNIANEEDKQIVEVFDRYGYIPLSNEYYTVSSVNQDISEEVLVLTSYTDLKYKEVNEKYNEEYYNTKVLIVVPFKASLDEIERGISVNSVYANMYGGVIVFNVETLEGDTDKFQNITFFFEVDYRLIDLDKILGIDVKSELGFDINITPDLFSKYINNIQVMVNNLDAFRNIEDTRGSLFYDSYKTLVNKDIMSIEGYENYGVQIFKNFVMAAEGDTYEERASVHTLSKLNDFKINLEKIKFVKSDSFFDTDEYLYQIKYDNIVILIIDAHHFDYWRYSHYVGTCEIVEGSFSFVNKYFYVENEALNDFLYEVYTGIEYLAASRLISSEKLDMLYDFCEIVRKWECVEDFGDYHIIDQLKIILDNIDFEDEMEVEIENAIALLEELLKDVKLKQRSYIHLDLGENDIEKVKVFEDEEYKLPIPTKKGMLFCGWYDEEGNVWEKGVYPYEEDITLYAKWVVASDFNLGGTKVLGGTATLRSIEKYNGSASEVILPSHDEQGYAIEAIDYCAFANNENIEKVYFSYTMKELDIACFRGCKNLKEVYLGESIVNLGHYAFQDCSSLTYVYFKEGITSTGNYTFHNCVSLESIEFPSTIYRYGVNMFQGCTNLRSITVREGGKFESVNNCVMNKDTLIIGCQTSVIPEYTKWIEEYAFYKIKFENEIILPSTLKYIDRGAFFNTSGLKQIVIPSSVVQIGDTVFACVTYKIYAEVEEKPARWAANFTSVNVVYGYVNE